MNETGTMRSDIEKVRVTKDFYAIGLTISMGLSTLRNGESARRDVYFKADRYSPYSGRLQVEWEAEDGQRFKTEKGARSAIERLLSKGTIKADQIPRVVRFTETITRRFEELG